MSNNNTTKTAIAIVTKNKKLLLTRRTEGKRNIKYVWDLLKSDEVDMDKLSQCRRWSLGFFGQQVNVYKLTTDHTPASKAGVECVEVDRTEVEVMPTKVPEAEDRTAVHLRVLSVLRKCERRPIWSPVRVTIEGRPKNKNQRPRTCAKTI
jgi:hypothetical protein